MCKLPTPCKLQICCIVAAVFAALSGAIFAPGPIHAQGSDNDYVDVAVILEPPMVIGRPTTSWPTALELDIVVVNRGSRTAYDVEVVVDIVYPEDSSHFESGRVDGVMVVPVGSASLENDKHRLRWSIPELGGLQRQELKLNSANIKTSGSSPTFDKDSYTHEFFGEVTTSSFDRNLENNTSRAWAVNYTSAGGHAPAFGNYIVSVAVDEHSPSPGGIVNFTITAYKEQLTGSSPIDLQVAIGLTDGLTVSGAPSYVSTDTVGAVVTKPDSVSYSNGVFTIGTLKFGDTGRINSVTLPVTVASSAVVNEQCLTAKLTGNPPPGVGPHDDDISDNEAKVCLAQLPPYFTSADLQEFVSHPCVGDSDPPCDNTDDVRVRAMDTTVDPAVILVSGTPVIHVPDNSETRKYDDDTDSVNGEDIVSWQVPVQISYRQYTSDHERWTDVSDSFSYEMPGKDGSFDKLHFRVSWAKALLSNEQRQAVFLATFNPGSTPAANGPFEFTAEFEKLGTYKVQYAITATHDNNTDMDTSDDVDYSATGSYIFHVGPPMVELEVRDGGASPQVAADRNALTIVAINNGANEPLGGARVTGLPKGAQVFHVSHGSYNGSTGVWNIDRLRVRDFYRSAGMSEPTLVLGASAGDTASVKIAGAKNYEVCVGPKSNQGDLAHTTKAACEAVTNASWNSTPVYDYKPGNNSATIRAAWGRACRGTRGRRRGPPP